MEGIHLPLELYRPIVERVDSKPALCALSRVCRMMNEETDRVLYSHFASHPRDVPMRLSRILNPSPTHSKLGRYLKSLELDLQAIAMEDEVRMGIDPDTQDPPIWSLYADLLKRCHILVSLTLLDIPLHPTLNLLNLIPPTIEHLSVVPPNSSMTSGAMLLVFLERQPNLRSIHLKRPMQLHQVAHPLAIPLRSLRKISIFSPCDGRVLAKGCAPVNLKAMLFSMTTTFDVLQWPQEVLEHIEWVFMPYVMLPAAWDTVKPFRNVRFFGIFQFTPQEVSSVPTSFALLRGSSIHQMIALTPISQEEEGRRVLAELPTLKSVSLIFPPGPNWNDKEIQAIQAIRTADNIIADHPKIQTAYMVQSSMSPMDLCILLRKDKSSIGWTLSRFKEGSTIRDLWAEL
jgi:hypothetical protein